MPDSWPEAAVLIAIIGAVAFVLRNGFSIKFRDPKEGDDAN